MAGEDETKTETTSPAVVVESEKKDPTMEEEETASKEEKKDQEKEAKEEDSKAKKKEPQPAVHKKDFEQDVAYLYQSNRCPQLPSISPVCLKTETWLKLNGIKYENIDHKSKLRSKKGLLPFVELNGEELADSEMIIKMLAKKFDKDIDEGLSQEHKNVQHAMISMVDNHLLWIVSQWRTRHIDNILKGYKLSLQSVIGSKFPNGLLSFAFKYTFLRKIARKVKATGLGEHSNEDIDAMGKDDLKVLSDLLGDKQFFFGDEPRTLDLTTFVQLALLVCVDKEVACPLRDYLESDCTNLVGLFNRMKDRAWGDHWAAACGEEMELNPHIPKPEPPKEEENKKEEEKEKADEKKGEEEKGDEKEKEKEENKEAEEKK